MEYEVDFDKKIALSIHPSSTMLVLCRVVGMLEPISLSKAGMGNFESDECQYFFSFIPRGQITNPRPHTFYTVLLDFLFINNKTCAFMLVQKGNFVVSWQKYYPTRQCKHLNCIVCKFATIKLNRGPFLY